MNRSSVALSLLLALFGAPRLDAQAFGVPLAPDQVTCEERQLARLVHRVTSAFGNTSLFLWRSTADGGGFRGLLSTNDRHHDPSTGGRVREERQLAFDLLLRMEGDFLNPRRPRLPQATLVRRDMASNVSPAPSRADDVVIDLEPEVSDPQSPLQGLRITNRTEPDQGSDDGAARGLAIDGLLTPCHDQVTDFDLAVFSILARTVRFSNCFAEPPIEFLCELERYKTAIYRGAEPLTYRMDIFTYTSTCDDDGSCGYGESRVPLLFRIRTDPLGRLTTGEVETLPWCTTGGQIGCIQLFAPSLGLFVLPPLRPGVDVQGETVFQMAPHLNIDSEGSEFNILRATVNWADLLRNTSWNGGLRP